MRSKADILKNLTEEQKKVVMNYNGRIVVNAAPGSGKTACVVARTEYMLNEGIKPYNILLFTFTKKAANEMKERLVRNIGEEITNQITICTYHGFCAKILRKYAKYIGYDSNFTIYDEDEAYKIFKNFVDKKVQTFVDPKKMFGIMKKWKMQFINPTEAESLICSSYEKDTLLCYKLYQQELKRSNAFDFDDLLIYANKIIKDNKSILEELAERYRYITADESHDSSKMDLNFILLLSSIYNNITLVADTDQSIYRFRGADIEYFTKTVKDYNFKIYNLTVNFRSYTDIVQASQSLIKKNESELDKQVISHNTEKGKIYYYICKDNMYEAKAVSAIIKTLVANKKNPCTYKDIAVIYRNNSQSRYPIESFLLNNIPFVVYGSIAFFSREEIKDVISFINFAINPNNVLAFKRSVALAKVGIGKVTLKKFMDLFLHVSEDYGKKYEVENYYENFYTVTLTPKMRKKFDTYFEIIRKIRYNIESNLSPYYVIKDILEKINYEKTLETAYYKDKEVLKNKKENLNLLLKIADAYNDFSDFSDFISANTAEDFNSGDLEAKENRVNLMTMHLSKGLEFKYVIIVGASEGICPSKWSLKDGADAIKEERRLFYVAMTRAKENLFILHSEVNIANTVQYLSESRFIKEIDSKYIKESSIS